MTESKKDGVVIHRILVAVDHSKRGDAAMQAAVMMAKVTKAQVMGLYVQEEHWNRLNQRPSATYINELTGKPRSFEGDHLNQQINRIANRLKRRFNAVSHQYEIDHSWQSIQGRVIEEILKAGQEVDLITIGRGKKSLLHQKKLGSTAKAIIEQSKRPVLVLHKSSFINRTIVVMLDEGTKNSQSLQLAHGIAKENNGNLCIIKLPNSQHNDEDRSIDLESFINEATIPVQLISINTPTLNRLAPLIKRKMPGMVILSKKHPILNQLSFEMLIHYLQTTVLFM